MKITIEANQTDLLASLDVAFEAIEHDIGYYSDHPISEPDGDAAIRRLRHVIATLSGVYAQIAERKEPT